jgi:flavin-dependent dehydrogenase
VQARFVLDASGFGRVLPKMLGLETPSGFPVRQSVFTHVADHIEDARFDRRKTLITIHPQHPDVWFWVIPFAQGRASIGVVAEREFLQRMSLAPGDKLRALVAEEPVVARLLAKATWDTPVREIVGYSANVSCMHGSGFALLGNAAEFLDPIFSSGVTIAVRSSSMAVAVLDRQLRGETVDWEQDFVRPLRRGVDTFRAYVRAWYDGRFQQIIFAKYQKEDLRRMLCSILAGYAWDEKNPFVADPERVLNVLSEMCARQ